MITEKLKSLVRFGTRSTRYKDVFDIYFLKDTVDVKQLQDCIKKYIFEDETLKNVTSMDEIIKRVERVFTNKRYMHELEKSEKNWIGIPSQEAMDKDLEFLKSIYF